MKKYLFFFWKIFTGYKFSFTGDNCVADSKDGNTDTRCGSELHPCKNIAQCFNRTNSTNNVTVLGTHVLNHTIQITGNTSIIGDSSTIIQGSVDFAFKVIGGGGYKIHFALSNVRFIGIGITSVEEDTDVKIYSCSVLSCSSNTTSAGLISISKSVKQFSTIVASSEFHDNTRPLLFHDAISTTKSNRIYIRVENSSIIDSVSAIVIRGNIRIIMQILETKFINLTEGAIALTTEEKFGSTVDISRSIFMQSSSSINFDGVRAINISSSTFYRESSSYHKISINRAAVSTIQNCLLVQTIKHRQGRIDNQERNRLPSKGMVKLVQVKFSLIRNCTFTNSTSSRSGGAVYLRYVTKSLINGCNFTGNSATLRGGAIYSIGVITKHINMCNFERNSATIGGAVYLRKSSNSLISNCNFKNNSAVTSKRTNGTGEASGGAIAISSSSNTSLKNNNFWYNYAQNKVNPSAARGGAVISLFSEIFSIIECSFERNSANTGGALHVERMGPLHILQSEFTQNTASAYGGKLTGYFIGEIEVGRRK